MMSSLGRARWSWRTTVSPPTPESNTPMGSSALVMRARGSSQPLGQLLVGQNAVHNSLGGLPALAGFVDAFAVSRVRHEGRFDQHGRHLRVAQHPEARPLHAAIFCAGLFRDRLLNLIGEQHA